MVTPAWLSLCPPPGKIEKDLWFRASVLVLVSWLLHITSYPKPFTVKGKGFRASVLAIVSWMLHVPSYPKPFQV